MNRSVLWVAVAALAVGCTTELQPIGTAGSGEAGSSGFGGAGQAGAGQAGVGGGIPVDAGLAGEGGAAAVGGYAGMAGIGAAGTGVGGGEASAACDDNDPCTYDTVYFNPDGTFYCGYQWSPDCGGMAGIGAYGGGGGVGGYAGEAGIGAYGGGGGVGGYAGEAGIGAYGGGGGVGGVGGYAGEAGGGAYGGAGAGGCGEMGFDEDGDGYQNTICGGDCDDNDEHAFPYQSSFFTVARSSGGYDYDCDGQVTLRWGELHSGCALDSNGQACVGSGWTSGDMTMFLPGCGQTSEYAFCEFTGTSCAVSMHTVTQACR